MKSLTADTADPDLSLSDALANPSSVTSSTLRLTPIDRHERNCMEALGPDN